MLTNPTSGRRLAGRAMVLVAVAVALPLTATWAVDYVDVPVPATPAHVAPTATSAAVASVPPVVAIAPVASVQAIQAAQPSRAVVADKPDISFIGKDTVHINGQTKRWEELTPSERAEIRARTDEARRDIEKHLARLPEELAQARRETERFRNGDFQREMAEAREGMQKALADIDQQATVLRATGQDPEKIKAEIRASLSEVEKMDIDKIVRESLASVDPDKIRREVQGAAQSLDEIQRKLDQLDKR